MPLGGHPDPFLSPSMAASIYYCRTVAHGRDHAIRRGPKPGVGQLRNLAAARAGWPRLVLRRPGLPRHRELIRQAAEHPAITCRNQRRMSSTSKPTVRMRPKMAIRAAPLSVSTRFPPQARTRWPGTVRCAPLRRSPPPTSRARGGIHRAGTARSQSERCDNPFRHRRPDTGTATSDGRAPRCRGGRTTPRGAPATAKRWTQAGAPPTAPPARAAAGRRR